MRNKKVKQTGQSKLHAFFGLLLIAGVGTMLYPRFSQWINTRHQDKVVDSYITQTEEYTDENLIEMREKAVRYNEKLAQSTVVMTDPFSEEAVTISEKEYEDTLRVNEEGLMGIVTIDSISVRLPIYHGTSEEVLSKAVGHLQGTSLPIGGENTHSVLSAHTGMASARLFTDLPKMKEGDIFILTALGEDIAYKVYEIEVLLPEEIDSLSIQDDRDLATLITCTPFGVNSHRLLVYGERTELSQEEMSEILEGKEVDYLFLGLVVIALVAFVVLVGVLRRRRKR
jgi:LPXTG-site transpeptidase (sortase) family protein